MEEFFARVWTNLIGRTEGPMHVAPPASTAGLFIFAIRSGLGDARENKPPFLLSQTFNLDRYQLRRQAWKDIGKLLIAATILDMVYQVIALHWIYPGEAVMSSDPSQGNAPVKLDTGTKLAYERTFPAYERTAMAWVRTTLTFITFGFTISKFFEYMRERNGAHAAVFGPPSVGILMIALGLISMAIATVSHGRAVQALRKRNPDVPRSPIGLMATLIFSSAFRPC